MNTDTKATVFDIQRNSFVDGPGIRTTVFFKGCNLKCRWCHNPESQRREKQLMFYPDKCTRCGRCKDITAESTDFVCFSDAKEICGKEYTVDEILNVVSKDKAFYENSGGGVTFSGGECMLQIDFLCEILRECKNLGIHTAIDTAGFVPQESFDRVLPYADLFLFDVKCFSESLHLEGTGVPNKLILENLQHLAEKCGGEKIIVRIPVIGAFNDTVDEMRRIAQFLKSINCRTVELLPYHKLGEHKYTALGLKCDVFSVPDEDKLNKLRSLFDF